MKSWYNWKVSFSVFICQAGIGGVCHTRYVIQEDKKNSRVSVTKTVDQTNCQEKVVKSLGMAYIYPCPADVMVRETWKDLPNYKHGHCVPICSLFGSPCCPTERKDHQGDCGFLLQTEAVGQWNPDHRGGVSAGVSDLTIQWTHWCRCHRSKVGGMWACFTKWE